MASEAEFEKFMGGLTGSPENFNPHEAEDKELNEALGNIWEVARQFKLDPFATHFEVVPPHIMNELGSYYIPNRFSHWTHGRAYQQLKTQYDYGLSKIYELVINSNPSQAFLLENNPPIENKFVMAHVLGHTDFFKNNYQFTPTRRDMPEAAAHDAERIRLYEERHGKLVVEEFLDAALSIEDHVDPRELRRPWHDEEIGNWREMASRAVKAVVTMPGEFDDLFGAPSKPMIGPEKAPGRLHIPPTPDSDIMGFIRNHAPYLHDWQRDVLDIVRSESIYFYPQRRTKIMNEGWAAYWHKRIMREMSDRGLITDKENEAWWRVHSGVVAESTRQLNPYHLGMKLYEYLEDYYNGNLTEQENAWLVSEGKPVYPKFEGRLEDSPASDKLREVMMQNDDQSFIRNYFDKNFAARMNMFMYERHTNFDGLEFDVVSETGWMYIRDSLVRSMDNCGIPNIVVIDGNHDDVQELYMRHEFEGKTLDPDYVKRTLPYIYRLWQRPVYLETQDGGTLKKVVYSYDGKEISRTSSS